MGCDNEVSNGPRLVIKYQLTSYIFHNRLMRVIYEIVCSILRGVK